MSIRPDRPAQPLQQPAPSPGGPPLLPRPSSAANPDPDSPGVDLKRHDFDDDARDREVYVYNEVDGTVSTFADPDDAEDHALFNIDAEDADEAESLALDTSPVDPDERERFGDNLDLSRVLGTD